MENVHHTTRILSGFTAGFLALSLIACSNSSPAAETDQNTEPPEEESSEVSTAPAPEENNGNDDVSAVSDELSFEAFAIAEDFLKTGIPANADRMDVYDALGEWQYELLFDSDDLFYKEIGTAYLDAGQFDMIFTLTPVMGSDAYEKYPIEEGEVTYDELHGGVEDQSLSMQSEQMTIVADNFFIYEDVQYVLGAITTGQGYFGTILLRR